MVIARKGRLRLSIFLCTLSGTACAVLMAGVLFLYGTPYNPLWWWVMAAVLAAALLLPLALVPVIEWVIAGYVDRD